jgi:hypothetical protein
MYFFGNYNSLNNLTYTAKSIQTAVGFLNLSQASLKPFSEKCSEGDPKLK